MQLKGNIYFIFYILKIIIAILLLTESAYSFSSLVGFGNDTSAGNSGRIILVTNLKSDGTGSLRDALGTKGPRIVVFEVGGVIDLGKKSIDIDEPFLTIAGQTAPSPGITLVRGGIIIKTHDILIQHIRIRPGDAGETEKSGWEPDGITTAGGSAYNIVIDHCSLSWAVDENLSASGPRTEGPEFTSHKVTFSNCIIAEGLDYATHSQGRHSKGSLIHDYCREIAVIGNLYAHNRSRNPYFKAHTTGIIVNNVIYNPGDNAIQLNYVESEWSNSKNIPQNAKVSIVGNVIVEGEDTNRSLSMIASRGDVYLDDNIAFDKNRQPVPITVRGVNILPEKLFWPARFKALDAKDVVQYMIKHAGARPKDRDEVDKRIISDFLNNKGKIINSQEDVGGYPVIKMTSRKIRIPDEGIENWLEKFSREVDY